MTSSSATILCASLAFALLVVSSHALTPGSACESSCSTYPIKPGPLCHDHDFDLDTGAMTRTCLSCLHESDADNGTESDLKWFLSDIRSIVDSCLFTTPSPVEASVSSSCSIDTACAAVRPHTSTRDSVTSQEWSFCEIGGQILDKDSTEPCVTCLRDSHGLSYLSNFVQALEVSCSQKPEPGQHLDLATGLFSNTTHASDSSSADTPSSSPTINIGATVGVSIAVFVTLVIAAVLFYIYWIRHGDLHRLQSSIARNSQYEEDPYFTSDEKLSDSLHARTVQRYYTTRHGRTLTAGRYYDQVEARLQMGQPHYARTAFAQAPQLHRRDALEPQGEPREGALPPAYTALAPAPPAKRRMGQVWLQRPPPVPPKTPGHSWIQRASRARVPSLTLPSLSKLRVPKQYRPPPLSGSVARSTAAAEAGAPGSSFV